MTCILSTEIDKRILRPGVEGHSSYKRYTSRTQTRASLYSKASDYDIELMRVVVSWMPLYGICIIAVVILVPRTRDRLDQKFRELLSLPALLRQLL